MIDTPQIIQTTAKQIAIIHLAIPKAEIQHVMGPGIDELRAVVAAQGIAALGPWFTHHLRMLADTWDFEIGVPVTATVVATGRVKPSIWPSIKVARTVYHGGFEGLGAAWGEFGHWIISHGHKPAHDLWERYLAGPETGPDPTQWRTELERPLLT